MNLHGIVAPIIGAVNPNVPCTFQFNDGYTTNPDGSRDPIFVSGTGTAQVQALTYKDLQQIDGLNQNGAARGIYFYGDIVGVLRARNKGGDLVTLTDGPNAGDWLVIHVLETWGVGWCKCACVLQNPQG